MTGSVTFKSEQTSDGRLCRLAAFDLDGTLFGRGGLSPADSDALIRLSAAGVSIAVCTGRHIAMIPHCVRSLGCVDYYMTSNGSCITDAHSGETLRLDEISPEHCAELGQMMLERGILANIYRRDNIEFSTVSWENMKRTVTPEEAERITAEFLPPVFFDDNRERLIAIPTGVQKIIAFMPDGRSSAEFMRDVGARLGVDCVSTTGSDAEFTAAGVNKGAALLYLCGRLGLTAGQTAAFGDSGNDVPMLRCAGISVAVGNNSAAGKAADIIAPGADESGVSAAIDALFFI